MFPFHENLVVLPIAVIRNYQPFRHEKDLWIILHCTDPSYSSPGRLEKNRSLPAAQFNCNNDYQLKSKLRVFSRDVGVAKLVSLNKGTAATLVSPTNPLRTEVHTGLGQKLYYFLPPRKFCHVYRSPGFSRSIWKYFAPLSFSKS